MEGFGPEKLIFVLLILILVFGARRLPEIGQSLGKGIREFKKSVRGDFDDGHAPQQPQQPQYQAQPQPQFYQPVPPQQLQAGVPVSPVAQAAPAAQPAPVAAPTQQNPAQA